MKGVQRGFHRFGIITAVATLMLGVAVGLTLQMEMMEKDYGLENSRKLIGIMAIDCKTGDEDPYSDIFSDVTCIRLGDGEPLQLPPNNFSKQVEAAKVLLAQRQADLEKARMHLFVTNVALTVGGSLLAALVVYGVFASLGWALAGYVVVCGISFAKTCRARLSAPEGSFSNLSLIHTAMSFHAVGACKSRNSM